MNLYFFISEGMSVHVYNNVRENHFNEEYS